MNNKLKKIKNKIRYHSYSIPVLGWCLRNTVGRRSRSHCVRIISGVSCNLDTAKIALIVWAIHYHPYKQVCRSEFTEVEYDFKRKKGVRIDVPSKKSLDKKPPA